MELFMFLIRKLSREIYENYLKILKSNEDKQNKRFCTKI